MKMNKDTLRAQFHAMLGVEGDISGTGSLRDQLRTIGGASDRSRSGVNLTQAAKQLGMSPGTLRGWLNQERAPSGKSLRKVRSAARRVGRTKAGRSRAVAEARNSGRLSTVASIDIYALQGPTRSGTDYLRERTVNRRLTSDQLDELLTAYEEGGEAKALEWINNDLEGYLPDWKIENTIDGGGFFLRDKEKGSR